ncbi:hypothetical protein VUR80DRAFT_3550 [Thermomyces stellatus]
MRAGGGNLWHTLVNARPGKSRHLPVIGSSAHTSWLTLCDASSGPFPPSSTGSMIGPECDDIARRRSKTHHAGHAGQRSCLLGPLSGTWAWLRCAFLPLFRTWFRRPLRLQLHPASRCGPQPRMMLGGALNTRHLVLRVHHQSCSILFRSHL